MRGIELVLVLCSVGTTGVEALSRQKPSYASGYNRVMRIVLVPEMFRLCLRPLTSRRPRAVQLPPDKRFVVTS